jgi:hypothetical protein
MSTLDTEGIDWAALRALRADFLEGTAGIGDYWTSGAVLSAYDRTFGERIGWKWDHVLDEVSRRGWVPPNGAVLDWACGTGVAGRRFFRWFPDVGSLVCADRSARARTYARSAAEAVGIEVSSEGSPSTVLVSHVLSELDEPHVDALLTMLDQATSVIWVEPGDRENSRRLQSIRDRLLGAFSVMAPCTHQESCPLLDEAMERHWCHHFAPTPPEAFTDPGWGRFVSETGIDIRSTPLSFIVMDRRPLPDPGFDAVHVIGRPRVSKVEARVFGCDQSGVTDARLTKRKLPGRYREAKKGRLDHLARWELEGDEVVRWEPW